MLKLACLSAVVGAAVAGFYYYHHFDEELRRGIEKKIAEKYSDLNVRVGSARIIEGEGIEIRRLSISSGTNRQSQKELISFGEIRLHCSTNLQDLANGSLSVNHANIRQLAIHAQQLPDGSWDTKKLFPLPKFGETPPTIKIESGTVHLTASSTQPARSLTFREIDLEIRPQENSSSHLENEDLAKLFQFRGNLKSDHFHKLSAAGYFSPKTAVCDVEGTIEKLDFSPALLQSIPTELANRLKPLESLRAEADLNFRVKKSQENDRPLQFVVSGNLAKGQIIDPRLPETLTDVQASVSFNNQIIKVADFTARSGLTQYWMNFEQDGLAVGSPRQITVQATHVNIDNRLSNILPASLHPLWRQFLPAGQADINLNLSFDGHTWQAEDFLVNCRDIAFTHYKFPYRLENSTGTIELKNKTIIARLEAKAGTQPIRISGDFLLSEENSQRRTTDGNNTTSESGTKNPLPGSWLEINANAPIPLDAELMAALNPKTKQVVTSLHPRGAFTLSARFDWHGSPDNKPSRRIDIQLHNCSIKYDKFRYPLHRIEGQVELINDELLLKNLNGYNDSGYVTCNGSHKDGLLDLTFIGTDISLEEELQAALPPETQKLWSDLRPRGSLDYLEVVVKSRPDQQKTSLSILSKKHSNGEAAGHRISIFPRRLPYQMDHVSGEVEYRDGEVKITSLKAKHGNVDLSIKGTGNLRQDGQWHFHVDHLNVDRLTVDRDLLTALNSLKLDEVVSKLNLSGPVSLHGSLDLKSKPKELQGVDSEWDIEIDMHNGGINCGLKFDHIFGSIRLTGEKKRGRFTSQGELKVDSAMFRSGKTNRSIQLTEISGPIRISRNQVLFGSGADMHNPNTLPRKVTAKTLQGTVGVDASLSLLGEKRFSTRLSLSRGDLATIARETTSRQQRISGKADAVVQLNGTCQGTHTWQGRGSVRLIEADIYELPLMVSLLKILTVKPPDRTAFTTSNIDFDIRGNYIYFHRIDFNGDAISLKGKGAMDLDGKFEDMRFYSLLGREELPIPILRSLIGDLSKQVWEVQVNGTLANPEPTKRLLPGLDDTLKQLFPEEIMSNQGRIPGSVPQRRY